VWSETPTYRRNFEALRAVDPERAAAVEAAAVPADLQSAVGRDGSATYRCSNSEGASPWFGGSSMPRVSAAALVERTAGQAGNVLMPLPATGAEVAALLASRAAYEALFVRFPQAFHAKLVLSLYDLSVASGRGG
jgi:hypothetical protein